MFRHSNENVAMDNVFQAKKRVQQVGRNSNRKFLRGYGQCISGEKVCSRWVEIAIGNFCVAMDNVFKAKKGCSRWVEIAIGNFCVAMDNVF